MKKIYVLALSFLTYVGLSAQANSNPYGVLYTMLNTRCQNASCHSSTSTGDNLKFDQDSASVYNQMLNIPSGLWSASVTEHNLLINPEMPYQSFLLRKIAGAGFDTDLSIDSNEGNLMVDINGTQLANYEIEYFRQWIRYGALSVYTSSQPQPNFATYYQYYMDPNYGVTTSQIPFLTKPTLPVVPGMSGMQFRMGPEFLPVTGAVEQEVTEQQEVFFPYLPQITQLDGDMTDQSHHLLLFQFVDSNSARNANCSTCGNQGSAVDINDIAQVTPAMGGSFVEPFSGNKNLTAAFQTPVNQIVFPAKTALFWEQHTYLDFDYHVKNYNAVAVLPADFYLNIYFEPRNPNTIQMISALQNNADLGEIVAGCYQLLPPKSLPRGTGFVGNYDDSNNSNSTEETRYLFMAAGHTHKFGTSFYIIRKDTTGAMADTIYNGAYDYANQVLTGTWDWEHPPIEYWNDTTLPHYGLMPVVFGGAHSAGLIGNTGWMSDSSCVHFGFTTNDEMQLYYYMYTTVDPAASITAISTPTQPDIYFEVVPNPTNGSDGKLVYNLDKDSKVEASIVDITGKTIADLGQETEVTGLHTVALSNGQKLASGIYFAKLIINGNFYTKKFVVTE